MSTKDNATVRNMLLYGGSFVRALGNAALAADPQNLARLKSAFPEYWADYAKRDIEDVCPKSTVLLPTASSDTT